MDEEKSLMISTPVGEVVSESKLLSVEFWEESWRKYSQHFIFFVTYGPNKLMLNYTRLERLARDKHSSILGGSFVSYEENVNNAHRKYSQRFIFFVTYGKTR
jgi:hypothetical protein